MRCYICDRVIDEPHYNEDHKDYDPCETCLIVINDLLEGDKDNAVAAEDELTTTDTTDIYLSWLSPTDLEDMEDDEESF